MAALTLVTRLTSVTSQAETNLGVAYLLKAARCPPDSFSCQVDSERALPIAWPGNTSELSKARGLLKAAVQRNSASTPARIHLAEVFFAQGERTAANQILAELSERPSGRSRLLSDDSYERRLAQAWEASSAERWDEALRSFYMAAATAPHRMIETDDRQLALVAANLRASRASEENSLRDGIMAAKLFAEAEVWEEAERWADWAGQASAPGATDATRRATTAYIKGRALAAQGDAESAEAMLQDAIAADPDWRLPYVELVELQRPTDGKSDAEIASELVAMGPGRVLGVESDRDSPGHQAEFPHGWRLAGYDVDEDMLGSLSAPSLVLWWLPPGEVQHDDTHVRVGSYLLERRRVRNLYANGGFEWGVDDKGIPVGQQREYYGAGTGSLTVEEDAERPGNHLLVAHNTPDRTNIALVSMAVAVDPAALYLMAADWRDLDGRATVGRNCSDWRYGSWNIHYLATFDPSLPAGVWKSAAEAAPALPGSRATWCELLVTNLSAQQPAAWDNVLFAEIRPLAP